MLTPGPESQGDLLQEQLELDLRNLFGSVAMSDDASDDDTCSSCSSVYSVIHYSVYSVIHYILCCDCCGIFNKTLEPHNSYNKLLFNTFITMTELRT